MAVNACSRLAAMLVGSATVVVLAGCSGSGTPANSGARASPATVTVTQSTATATQSAPTGTQSATPSNPSDVASPAPQPPQADEPGTFLSPSGNIICGVSTTGATCEIREFTYAPPPKPSDCHLGWGDRISLDPGSAPVLNCHGDTQFGSAPGQPTLPYGKTRSAGTITCDSAPIGITCTDSSTGHYFQVSRESLEIG